MRPHRLFFYSQPLNCLSVYVHPCVSEEYGSFPRSMVFLLNKSHTLKGQRLRVRDTVTHVALQANWVGNCAAICSFWRKGQRTAQAVAIHCTGATAPVCNWSRALCAESRLHTCTKSIKEFAFMVRGAFHAGQA